jgi:hypothetical protein
LSKSPLHALSPVVELCVEIATQWHDGTYRKGAWRSNPFPDAEGGAARVPVISHLIAVGLILQRMGWDDATVGAGFLHDVLEDCDRSGRETSRRQLEDLVGKAITDIVAGVTEIKRDTDGTFRPWKDRKTDYLTTLAGAGDRCVAVSLADKIHNLWTMNASLDAGIDIFTSGEGRKGLSAGLDDQVWFFGSILEIAEAQADPRIREMCSMLAGELERFRSLAREDS